MKSLAHIANANVVIIDNLDNIPTEAGKSGPVDILLINKKIKAEIRNHDIWAALVPTTWQKGRIIYYEKE